MNSTRLYLTRVAKITGLAGVVLASVPFIGALMDGEETADSGADGISLEAMAPGEVRERQWRGRPVVIYRRRPGEPGVPRPGLHPEFVVLSPLEGLRGCRVRHVPAGAADAPVPDWQGGFVDPCFGARFDLSGLRDPASGRSAQGDLDIPPYRIAPPAALLAD